NYSPSGGSAAAKPQAWGSMISPHALSLMGAATAIAERRFTARALADAQLACIDATDSQIDAWATLDRVHVHAEADRCDAANTAGLLGGIGIGVKDIIATRCRLGWARRFSQSI